MSGVLQRIRRAAPSQAIFLKDSAGDGCKMTQRTKAILTFFFAVAVLPAHAFSQVQFSVSSGKSSYQLDYSSASRSLTVQSRNLNASWNRRLEGIASLRNFAAAATPAGPIVVYQTSTGIKFSLMHWRNGGNTVDRSKESLDGVIGAGRMQSCLFMPAQYGAKVVVEAVESGNLIQYRWDINHWGTHKLVGKDSLGKFQQGRAPNSRLTVNQKLGFSLDVPHGFREIEGDDKTISIHGPVPDLFLTVYSEQVTHDIKELGDGYMKEMKLKVQQVTSQTLDDGTPALLYIGDGTINGVPSKSAALVFAAKGRTYVVTFHTPVAYKAHFMFALEEVLRSMKPL